MLFPYLISFDLLHFTEQDENSEEKLEINDIEIYVILGIFFFALLSFSVATKNKGTKKTDIKVNDCKKVENKVSLNIALK